MTRKKRWQKRNDEGLEMERQGRPDEAISLYEANLSEGCDTSITYHRLAILYRGRTDYDNEVRVLEKALGMVGHSAGRLASFERRLQQAQALRAPDRTPVPVAKRISLRLTVATIVLLLLAATGFAALYLFYAL